MPDIIRPLPAEITDLIRALGGRKLVLLEGPDDELFFTEIFLNRLADVAFLGVTGKADVIARLNDLAGQRPDVTAFGILDRDFASDAEVRTSLADPTSKCFLLRRYAIENYALEPQTLWNVLRVFLRKGLIHNSSDDVENLLLTLCKDLQTVMAAKFVIRQASDELSLFHEKHEIWTRDNFIAEVARRVGIAPADAEQQIANRESAIGAALTSNLESAHTVINGKHLLYRVWQSIKGAKKGLSEEYLFSQLIEGLKTQPIHPDLTYIVENRILGDV